MTPRQELDEFIAKGDMYSILCQKGIDFMYWISHITGYSYEQVNIFILYILIPCIIALFAIASYICYMKFAYSIKSIPNKYKYCAYGWSVFLIYVCLDSLYKLVKYIMRQDWTIFCHEQIQKLFDIEWLDYGSENISRFIIMPLIVISFPIIAMIYMRIFKGNLKAFLIFSCFAIFGIFGACVIDCHLTGLLPTVLE